MNEYILLTFEEEPIIRFLYQAFYVYYSCHEVRVYMFVFLLELTCMCLDQVSLTNTAENKLEELVKSDALGESLYLSLCSDQIKAT